MNHVNFASFMEHVVLPKQAADPTQVRLDGQTSGGNRTPAGFFYHQGMLWRVHADSQFEPLVVAYQALKERPTADPFFAVPTGSGKRHCLVLTSELQQKLCRPRFKHLYIYEV